VRIPVPWLAATLVFAATETHHAAAFHNPFGKWPRPEGPGDQRIHEVLNAEARHLASVSLAEIQSLEDWERRKASYRTQLFEMLGLDPQPPKTALHATVTGKLEESDFIVEKFHFQSLPGLYVTANLYLPRPTDQPVPAILYVCGHSVVKTNGVSFGNKVGYQHHGVGFARNGYACLVLDTVQLGEIEGIHHGTYREGMWWWNSRGYTSAGAEAWNCIRALDYLESRPEVDARRIGVTGRSGGGAYSWWISALDDRIRAACPVAGMTDLENHVVDGTVEGHCDCMFHVNTYRWDFDRVAALVAPRPLLIGNTDKDTIFPLDGVVRIHERVRRIYDLHRATDRLGLLITEGPHKDNQDLQVPVLRWFNRFLKHRAPVVKDVGEPLFTGQQLKVLDRIPSDEITSRSYEHFPRLAPETTTSSHESLVDTLRHKTFGGWPEDSTPPQARLLQQSAHTSLGLELSVYEFVSQPGLPLRLYRLLPTQSRVDNVVVEIADSELWNHRMAAMGSNFPRACEEELKWFPTPTTATTNLANLASTLRQSNSALMLLAPRGVGMTALASDARFITQTRRRFMLVGQTLAGMQVWDVRRGLQAIQALADTRGLPVTLAAPSAMTEVACFAIALGARAERVELAHAPRQDKEAPDFLNWSRWVTPARLLDLARAKSTVTLDHSKR